MSQSIIWHCVPFHKLSLEQLYRLLQIRQEVFIIEQNCPYLDNDDKDQPAWHLWAERAGKMLGCTRILPAGISYPDHASIGRVLTHPSERGTGLGKELMVRSIQETRRLFPDHQIKIGAQSYLKRFYEGLGFIQSSEEYLEDDIPHIEMELKEIH